MQSIITADVHCMITRLDVLLRSSWLLRLRSDVFSAMQEAVPWMYSRQIKNVFCDDTGTTGSHCLMMIHESLLESMTKQAADA